MLISGGLVHPSYKTQKLYKMSQKVVFIVYIVINRASSLHVVNSLNGANGEFTGSDDVDPGGTWRIVPGVKVGGGVEGRIKAKETQTWRVVPGVRGAGMVNNKVKNSGTGGKSKVKKEPQTTPAGAAAAASYAKKNPDKPVKNRPSSKGNNGAEKGSRKPGREKKGDGESSEPGAPESHSEGIETNVGKVKMGLKKTYIHADKPIGRTLFDELPDQTELVDPFGAPFCGLTCIDLCVARRPNVREYCDLAGEQVDVTLSVGTPNYLANYAAHRGVNLIIMDSDDVCLYKFRNNPQWKWVIITYLKPDEKLQDGEIVKMGPEDMFEVVVRKPLPDPAEDLAAGGDGMEEVKELTFGDVGHYVYHMELIAPETDAPLADLPVGEYDWRHIGRKVAVTAGLALLCLHPVTAITGLFLTKMHVASLAAHLTPGLVHAIRTGVSTVHALEDVAVAGSALWACTNTRKRWVKGDRCFLPNSRDRRNLLDQRDELKFEDSYRLVYTNVVVSEVIELSTSRVDFRLGPYHASCNNFLPKAVSGYLGLSERLVSEMRFNAVFQEMQLLPVGIDAKKAIISLGRYREVNTHVNGSLVLLQTQQLLEELAGTFWRRAQQTDLGNAGLIVDNAKNDAAYIPNVDIIVANQALQGRGAGKRACGPSFTPFIKNYRLEDPKVGVPVAVAPIGAPVTSYGVLGPGLLSVSDSPGLLAAFAGRSMARDIYATEEGRDEEALGELLSDAYEFLGKMVEETDVSQCEEPYPNNDDYIRSFYQGKKTAVAIESIITEYKDYLDGRMSMKSLAKFQSHSAFVKFESNIKADGDRLRVRPRLIMTMSSQMLYELAPITALFHAWNEGPFGKYQVKGMSKAEMCEKVEFMQDRPHCVTDMSSFEASIDDKIRRMENFVLRGLIKKSGMHRTMKAFNIHVTELRKLKSKWGTFVLSSRCSGDFWTSFGNGIVNVAVQYHLAKRRGYNLSTFRMIAEGDDGVIEKEMIDVARAEQVGFKLSSQLEGTRPGDTDFLRSRWVDGKRLLNVGRCLNVFWVKGAAKLRAGKTKYILRCMGQSLHEMSPGHPILYEIVNRIGKLTAGATDFKGSDKFLCTFKNNYNKPKGSYPRNVRVDESLRALVALGASGFPPISVHEQLEFEKRLREDNTVYMGNLLNDYEEVINNSKATPEGGYTAQDPGHLLEMIRALESNDDTRGCIVVQVARNLADKPRPLQSMKRPLPGQPWIVQDELRVPIVLTTSEIPG